MNTNSLSEDVVAMFDKTAITAYINADHAARKHMRRFMKDVITAQNLEFTYVRPYDEDAEQPFQYGGAVVAWKMPKDASNVLEISVAWCHPNDKFDSVLGRYAAACEFKDGRRIKIRLPEKGMYSQQLRSLFIGCL